MKSLITAIVMVSLVLTAAQAQAALLAYDGFETVASGAGPGQYNAGQMQGQGPGLIGFDGGTNWTGSYNTVRPIDTVATTSLTYPNLSDLGGSVSMTRVAPTGGFITVANRVANTAGSLPEADVTRWASFLIQPDMNFVGSVSSDDPFELITTFGQNLRLTLEDDLSAGNLSLVITPDDTTTPLANRTLTLTEDATHLVLMRIEHTNGSFGLTSESVSVWLDPDLALGESNLGVADITANGLVIASDALGTTLEEFATVRLEAALENNGSLAQTVFFDEFRIGMTALDVGVLVVPVPEPSSLLLLGLGALGLARQTRRRRSQRA